MFLNIQRIHFVGIGGIGMSGIAEVLLNLGFQVSGSDLKLSPATERLASLGAEIFEGHAAAHIEGAQVVVISSAVKGGNPEVSAAHLAGLPVIPRGEMLAELMRLKKGIAVAGAHGKTTTTSLVAQVLNHGGLDPTIVVGGRLASIGSNAKLGQGDYLVCEADESDGSFLLLSPTLSVITNLDREHLEHYGSLENLQQAFVDFANKVPFYGLVYICLDDPQVQHIRSHIKRRVRTYGINPQVDVRALNLRMEGLKSHFQVRAFGQDLGEFALPVPGQHMVLNALAAIGIGLELGLSPQSIREALAAYPGTDRRFSVRGESRGILVVDDYGHHPTEIMALLAGARASYPDRRIVACFQPHRYTRTRSLLEEFGRVFLEADVVVLTEIYAAGESPIAGISGSSLADVLRKHGQREVHFVPLFDELPTVLRRLTRPDDLLLTIGAGSITKIGPAFLEAEFESIPATEAHS